MLDLVLPAPSAGAPRLAYLVRAATLRLGRSPKCFSMASAGALASSDDEQILSALIQAALDQAFEQIFKSSTAARSKSLRQPIPSR
jgi:hypothetical protein